ncbi:hypothetical protein SLE2022_285620 [Rubroshorea leprosula]
MDMNKFRSESHVAQQNRRDKLRIHPPGCNDLFQNPGDFHPGINPDFVQVRNVRNANLLYDPTLVSSSALHFSTNSDVLPAAQRDEMLEQEIETAQHRRLVLAEDLMSPSILTHFNAPSRVGPADRQGYDNLKSIGSKQDCDWMMSYASGSSGKEDNQNPLFGGAVLSNNARESNISATTRYLNPAYDSNQDVQSTSINPCSEICGQDGRNCYSDLHIPSAQLLYNSTVPQDVVTAASVSTRAPERVSDLLQQNIREAVPMSWATDYSGNQSGSFHLDIAGSWIERPLVDHGKGEGEHELRIPASDATTQGLALSLSSNPLPKVWVAQLGEEYASNGLQSRSVDFEDPQNSKILKPLHSMDKSSIISKASAKSLQEIVGTSSYIHRQHIGPLGPFTGYATILKNSRFLKPAQEVLEDFCEMTNSKLDKLCKGSEGISGEVSASASMVAARTAGMEAAVKGNNSGASSSTFYSSNENSGDCGLGSSSIEQPSWPQYQQKKAKLLYLQEEVCKRYKLYYQQMQMVVSSFESVAGLGGATPYISLALKTLGRKFRSLKNAISEEIKHTSRALGEDFFSPTTGMTNDKGDMYKLKYLGQKSSGVNVGFLEPQQHSWRPQRGLPESSVAILRAWLFEHFLHPYPTDTDKHMLATQTGLTRNQVSNWFINARVRLWKPMVEEIHMLESKGLAGANQINSGKTDTNSTGEGTRRQNTDDHAIFKPPINDMSNRQLVSSISDMHHMVSTRDACADQWNQEKRSRDEFNVPTRRSMDGSLIGFVPYQRGQLDIGGHGAVSLTLGLRHGVDSSRQQQQQQEQFHQQEDQLRRQFGGQMIHNCLH